MGWESSGVVGFDPGPLLEGQMRTAKLKSAYNLLIIGPRGFGALSLRWIQFASVSDALGLVFAFSAVRCPASDVRRHAGFRSFKGKVLELLSPSLVSRLIGSVACLGLLLAVVPLLLTE